MLDEHDQDPAEGIDYKSFEQILSSLYIGRTFDDLVNRAFDVFASEGKGHITLKGLRRITKDVGQSIDEEELKDMIRMFDRNEDGVIDKVRSSMVVALLAGHRTPTNGLIPHRRNSGRFFAH